MLKKTINSGGSSTVMVVVVMMWISTYSILLIILPTVFPSHESAIAIVDETLGGRGKSICVLSSSFCNNDIWRN